MTDFNPLAGAILGSAQAQHQADIQKQRQVRRAQTIRKDAAAPSDQFEHQVESPEEPAAIHDSPDSHPDHPRKRKPRRPDEKDDGRPHIDITA